MARLWQCCAQMSKGCGKTSGKGGNLQNRIPTAGIPETGGKGGAVRQQDDFHTVFRLLGGESVKEKSRLW